MSFSERSFGARVDNAQKLLTHLQNFKDYKPLDKKMEIAYVEWLISETKEHGNLTAGAIEDYSGAVELRQQLYFKSPDSLRKLVSPIASTVRAVYGKDSKESNTVAKLVAKIRGNVIKKPKKSDDENAISQSERSFGNMNQDLADLMVIISKYKYAPANKKIEMTALQDLHAALEQSNLNVTTTFGKQIECRKIRQQKYDALNNATQRIKDAIKSQYGGLQSIEYGLVKGLKI